MTMSQGLASVLLIEDNPGDARLVREHLSDRFGDACRLHQADSLDSGLRWLNTQTADLILLDLSLPDSQGLETFFSIHAHAPGTPVVILSGHDDDELALDAVRAGAEDYLAKQHADGVALARSMRHAVERRRVEKALRESEALYRTIVETAEEGILQLDERRTICFVNSRMASMISRPPDQLLGRRFEELVDPSQAEAAIKLLALCAMGERRTMEVRFRRDDGAPRWALMAAGSVHAFGSEAYGLVVMLSDVTGRMLAEQDLARLARGLEERVAQRTAQLEAANAELTLFNHAIAHDLRTPLNAVVGYASLLAHEEGAKLSPTGQQHLQVLKGSAQDMDELVGGLLSLSQLDHAPARRVALDLSAQARSVIEQLQMTEPGRRVEVVIDPGLQAEGDPALVRDVLANLLGNAWKYTGRCAQPWLHVGLALADGRETVFVVQDNGVGFDMRASAKLFQPFQRLASSEGFEGTGVGLATVRRIVERHGGRVWAESQPGQRTSFFFTLAAPTEPASP